VWDEEARNQICSASEVWSLRQFLRAKGQWPDELPSNGGRTRVVAGLDGSFDLPRHRASYSPISNFKLQHGIIHGIVEFFIFMILI